MNFADSPREATWRQEVRTFLNEQLPKDLFDADGEGGLFGRGKAMQVWRQRVATKGWIAPHWPKEYGGAGMGIKDQFVMNEEFAEAEAPNVGGFGVMMIGPTLISHASEEQKQRFLPGIIKGETIWCQGYSEPGAGSDVASLQTRAVRDGDDYVLNGQKIWTTGAQYADWMYMLARTDPDAPKHRGISMLLFDMKSPGITVRPLTTMANAQSFNEVFFDNVRVPVSQRIGEENRGWYVGATLLDFERSGIGNAVGVRKQLERFLNYVRKEPEKLAFNTRKSLRGEFADRWIEASVAKWLSYRVISMQAAGQIPNAEASLTKLFMSEMQQRIATLGMHMLGVRGMLGERGKYNGMGGRMGWNYVGNVSSTIAGGTSEIQRNIIAQRGLGLPRA
ncbi:MAG: acyl-CoA dehydrogenase family protein [Chloroflexi bacterium]|nr:acyl-CoA dehydrogenase family protein [Chloroflexota bacterium]